MRHPSLNELLNSSSRFLSLKPSIALIEARAQSILYQSGGDPTYVKSSFKFENLKVLC